MMKKLWGAYWAAAGATAAGAGLLWWISSAAGLAAAAAAAVFLVWWTFYYRKLHYSLENNALIIQSGIVFQKEIHIPTGNILWSTRVSLCLFGGRRMALFTLLRTASRNAVIFAEYFTDS